MSARCDDAISAPAEQRWKYCWAILGNFMEMSGRSWRIKIFPVRSLVSMSRDGTEGGNRQKSVGNRRHFEKCRNPWQMRMRYVIIRCVFNINTKCTDMPVIGLGMHFPQTTPIPFMSEFVFQIWIFKSWALQSSDANTDLATGIVAARCLGKKDSPRIILSDNIVRFGPLSMLEAQGTPKSHRDHYGECPRPIPNTSDNQQLADCNTIRYGHRYVFSETFTEAASHCDTKSHGDQIRHCRMLLNHSGGTLFHLWMTYYHSSEAGSPASLSILKVKTFWHSQTAS